MRNLLHSSQWIAGCLLTTLSIALLAGCRPDGADRAPRRDEVRPVLLIAVDGATWDVIDPMIAQGELPNLAALAERGMRGRLIAVEPLSSPVVWTTIATGRFAREHGILDFTFPYEANAEKLLVRSTVRKVPAIWNVASDAGLSTAVVGYFVTHPAESIRGVMVSDRAYQGVSGSVSPIALRSRIETILAALGQRATERALRNRFIHWDYDRTASKRPEDPFHRATKIVSGRIDKRIIYDEFVRRATLELMAEPHDLTMTYLRIVDHASHVGWLFHDDSEFDEPADPHDRELLSDLIRESYRYVDDVVGDLVAAAGGDANIVVVSDHGFGSATGFYSIRRHPDENLTGNHRYDGILLAAGPDIRRGSHDRMTIVDVAPTLMALLDLPISRELPGRIETELFTDALQEELAPRYVSRYDFDWSSPASDESVTGDEEREALEALEALGYIGNTSVSGASGDGSFDFWSIDRRLRQRALVGELTYLLYRGDERRARAVIAEILDRDPDLGRRLRQILLRQTRAIEKEFGQPLFEQIELGSLFPEIDAASETRGDRP